MKKLNKLIQTPVLPILGVIFLLIAGTISYTSQKKILKPKIVSSKNTVVPKNTEKTPVLTAIPKLIKTIPTAIPTQIKIKETNTPIPNPTNIKETSAPQTIKLTLTINGASLGTLDIPQGSNQCDVLNLALSTGKIQSLNMRYNNDFGTNAVYQINGVGKENAVWWGFNVNGQSPSQGCSYIKVNNNDNVLWEYVGN